MEGVVWVYFVGTLWVKLGILWGLIRGHPGINLGLLWGHVRGTNHTLLKYYKLDTVNVK